MSLVFVLGAPDAEMAAIESLLTAHGAPFVHAMSMDGSRRAVPAECAKGEVSFAVPAGHSVVLVEVTDKAGTARVVDHHTGSERASWPAERAVAASSLGQVAELLGVKLTPEQAAVAALDHNLRATLRGEVPGVDPDFALELRARQGAAFAASQGRSVMSPEAAVEAAKNTLAALRAAPVLFRDVRDMRRADGQLWLSLPDVAARAGLAYVAGPVRERDGKEKLVVSGEAADVEAFGAWANDAGLTGVYLEPARGLGGGYLPTSSP